MLRDKLSTRLKGVRFLKTASRQFAEAVQCRLTGSGDVGL